MKWYFCLGLALGPFLGWLPHLCAGIVRNLPMDGKAMEVIRLRLGRSTVLRFPSAPTKVIIGNNNYYQLEFVGSDLTIQPRRLIPTNLFVYTKAQVYGFLLMKGNEGNYDDLVSVRFKSATASQKAKVAPVQNLSLKALSIAKSGFKQKILILEFEIENHSKEKIDTQELKLYATSQKKRLLLQSCIFAKDSIPPKQSVKARIFLRPKHKRPLEVELHFAGEIVRQTYKGDL